MRLRPFVNTLLLVLFLAVIFSFAIMLSAGYSDKVTHTCFILHAASGFLLLARAALTADPEPTK
jgi:hypothetical protein